MRRCCWPIGDPGEPGFHFCDAPVARPSLPYCDLHAAIAFKREPKVARIQKSRRLTLPDLTTRH
jgi:hypothetical protein